MPSAPRHLVVLCTLLALGGAQRVLAQGAGVESVVVSQRVRLEGSMTKGDAERSALESAMAEAVRRVAGVRVSGTESMTTADSAGSISSRYLASVRLDAVGHVVGWKTQSSRWAGTKARRGATELEFQATYVIAVARDSGTPDASFRVSVGTNRDRLAVRGEAPSGNDEVVVTATSTRDAHLTIVSISGDSVRRLMPNSVIAEARAVAGVSAQWPSAEWRERGLHLRVGLPRAVDSRSEVVAVVATLEPVAWPEGAGGAISLTDFNRWLVAIPASRRAVAQATVVVERVRGRDDIQ